MDPLRACHTRCQREIDAQSLIVTDSGSTLSGQTNIQVSAAAATHFLISGPTSVPTGTAFSITVTALDAYNNIATGYTGTVHFSDSASGTTLPANYKFIASDAGCTSSAA